MIISYILFLPAKWYLFINTSFCFTIKILKRCTFYVIFKRLKVENSYIYTHFNSSIGDVFNDLKEINVHR